MGEDPISEFPPGPSGSPLRGTRQTSAEEQDARSYRHRSSCGSGRRDHDVRLGLPGSPCEGIASTTRNFTIVASVNGFNDSKDHQGQWPIMNVHRCDMVKVTIINGDTQTHGFAIDNYAIRGTEIQGGQTLSVPPFLASKIGQFRVFCISFCTVHRFMQNGLLNVV